MIQDHEFLKPQRIPFGWRFDGYGEDFTGAFSMIGHIVGIHESFESVCTTAPAHLHIVVSDKPLVNFYSVFKTTETGGLESWTKGAKQAGAVVRQIHLVDAGNQWPEIVKLFKSRQECRIEGVFFSVDVGDPLYEFRGFSKGCACPLGRIDSIHRITRESSIISDIIFAMRSSIGEFVGNWR